MKNVVIIGAGICGLTAAIYTARAHLQPIVISGPEDGGQLTLTTDVENWPGYEHGVLGPELVATTKKQAQRFGAEFLMDYVESITKIDGGFAIKLSGSEIQTKTVILATGASARWLGLESEKQYKGRGVTTCATCDGFFYRGKEVIVIGGGDSAMEEATFLTKFATKVTVIHRKDHLRASKAMQDKFFANPKCHIVWNSEVAEVVGDGKKVTGVKLKNTVDGTISDFATDGVFLAIGHVPNTSMVKDLVDVDPVGYVITQNTKTKTPGLFAAGDVQDSKYRQAITAAGSGCMAALEAERFIAGH